jgi:hypothetical protein
MRAGMVSSQLILELMCELRSKIKITNSYSRTLPTAIVIVTYFTITVLSKTIQEIWSNFMFSFVVGMDNIQI